MFQRMYEHTYHLLSNAQPSLFSNKACEFTNRIIPPLYLPQGEQWQVGLKEFSVVNTLQTIPRDLCYERLTHDKTERRTQFTLSKGFYSYETLMKALNQSSDILAQGFQFGYTKLSNDVRQVSIKTNKKTSLRLDPMLADILGLSRVIEREQTRVASLPLQLNSFCYNIIVYCDIVDESSVGGQREKILRVIPFESDKYMDVFRREFIHVDYLPLNTHNVSDISIRLMSDYGELLPLVDGRSYVKLHFRKASK